MNVMKQAWKIAKEAVVKFGGKAREYLADALKNAWLEEKMRKVDSALKAAKDAQVKFSRAVNEGGYGYNPHDSKVLDLVIEKSKLWREYMLLNGEYFRVAWCTAVRKYAKNGQVDMADAKKVEAEAGITLADARWLKEQMTK